MTSFIEEVLKDIIQKYEDVSKLVIVLPSKRAGVFLRHILTNMVDKTIFSPSILSVEDFIEELSQIKKTSNTELLFLFYETYLSVTPKEEVEDFDTFSKWAQILLQDFNEIDRYLIPPEKIFDYISAIQDINHWSVDDNRTPLINNYLVFWKRLHTLYSEFAGRLLEKGIGYQGLIYREAANNTDSYLEFNHREHIFLGFNALNSCETVIIQEFLKNKRGDIYWDLDNHFIDNKVHQAGFFIRGYKSNWNHYNSNPFKWTHDHYTQTKNISVTGIPKNVGQAKYIGELLLNLEPEDIKNIAVVLSDENLLTPVLNSLPENIKSVNITMGLPLNSVPLASLFEQLFLLHNTSKNSFYFKDVISIISHQFISQLFKIDSERIIETIHDNNLVFINVESLIRLSPKHEEIIKLLFENWQNNPKTALKKCQNLILKIKNYFSEKKEDNRLTLEYLYRFNQVFNTIHEFNSKYEHITSITALQSVYKEILSSETLDFKGEPLEGLQIMGMLESRALDFDHVIIASVNEGILPAGKSNNSFIPFDVKLQYGLPTFKEKDAVYTYHFYRLIQRATTVQILYNTEVDTLNGGEKSRFITQLEIEGIHHIDNNLVIPETPKVKTEEIIVTKTNDIIGKLKELAGKGFSPSSLTNYIRNPIYFYYQKVLGIKQFEEVEETVAANTLGTVVHNTLEDFYKPIEGKFLTLEMIKKMTSEIDDKVLFHFKAIYKEGDITKGKNLIIYEIAKRYVSNFLSKEINDLKKGNSIKILEIETNLNASVNIPNISFPITLTGKVDRIDEYNRTVRIIDYKTGKVEQNKVEIVDWEDITTDYTKYSKSFQVLMYAYMMNAKQQFNTPVEAGIISFKNLNAGFLKFAKKNKIGRGAKKETLITKDTLDSFEKELKTLLLEIYNPDIPFIEKTDV